MGRKRKERENETDEGKMKKKRTSVEGVRIEKKHKW